MHPRGNLHTLATSFFFFYTECIARYPSVHGGGDRARSVHATPPAPPSYLEVPLPSGERQESPQEEGTESVRSIFGGD